MTTVTGTFENETLFGGVGDDEIDGLDGDDHLDGGAGADTLVGGAGNDSLVGDSETGADSYLFGPAHTAYANNFGTGNSWTSQDQMPRLIGDVNGDERADIVAFSGTNVLVALGQSDGTFAQSQIAYGAGFTSANGWTSLNTRPRELADVNGDGRIDIVGFAPGGVVVALGQANGIFASATTAYANNFGTNNSWTSQDQVPRLLGDVNGDGRADIVAFSSTNVLVAEGQANGTFATAQVAYSGWFTSSTTWQSQNLTPRLIGDVNGDGRADIVGFASDGVYVALGRADSTFAPATLAYSDWFTLNTTWNSQDRHPRQLADVNGDGRIDIVGFAGAGAYVALGQADGTFATAQAGYLGWYGAANSWTSQNKTPRQVADVNGDGLADIIGFTSTSVVVSEGQRNDDTLVGGAGDDTLNGGAGADIQIGQTGDDIYYVDNVSDVVIELEEDGTDTVISSAGYELPDNVEILILTGASLISGIGNSSDNHLFGNGAANLLVGLDGNDTIDGGTGNDTLLGGTGADTYVIDDAADVVLEYAGEGTDEVRTALSTITLAANVEALTYIGTGAFTGTGNIVDNLIHGGSGNDTLAGGVGDDRLYGSFGTDQLNGGTGDDMLDGGFGADLLFGGMGGDIYVVDDADDHVVEMAGEGTDEVRTSLGGYTLTDNFETLIYTGTGPFTGTGNALANRIAGSSGADTLDGAAGADTLLGGLGNDIYLIDDTGDLVVENAGEGTDEVVTALAVYTLTVNAENLTYTGTGSFTGTGNAGNNTILGGSGADTLFGDAGNDTLNGGADADLLAGGTGNDVYLVDDAGDVVSELTGQGTDTVRTALSTVTLAANVENLAYTGTGPLIATGNAGNNSLAGGAGADTLTGLDGNDTLNGGAGADTLIGGTGNDTYVVDNAGDVIVELPGEGTDTVQTGLAHSLLDEFENLTLTGGGAVSGTGNAAANVITGNGASNLLTGLDGNDTLNGGGGADTLVGGLGDDGYVVDNAGDVVVELAGEGTDTVTSSIAWTLGDTLERLVLSGGGNIAGTGNALDNVITGNGGANTLDGGAGIDTLIGGGGNDVYIVADAGDVVTEAANQGIDELRTSLSSWTLGANLERLTFSGSGDFTGTGNALDNVITGGAGDDTLTGGDGNDTLIGGAGADWLLGGEGDDLYVVSTAGATVVETTVGGTDTIRTDLSTVLLTDQVENLEYSGSADFTGIGNLLDNMITGGIGNDTLDGGAGNDTLDGGAGADTLTGGLGDDQFLVDDAGDVVVEASGDGTDSVLTGLASWTLGAEVENLMHTGTADFAGTGNALANALTGGTGNDTLDGGAGDDLLTGGAGGDRFLIGAASGADSVADFDAAGGDLIVLTAGQGWAVGSTAGGDALIDFGTGDSLTLLGIAPASVSAGWFVTI